MHAWEYGPGEGACEGRESQVLDTQSVVQKGGDRLPAGMSLSPW